MFVFRNAKSLLVTLVPPIRVPFGAPAMTQATHGPAMRLCLPPDAASDRSDDRHVVDGHRPEVVADPYREVSADDLHQPLVRPVDRVAEGDVVGSGARREDHDVVVALVEHEMAPPDQVSGDGDRRVPLPEVVLDTRLGRARDRSRRVGLGGWDGQQGVRGRGGGGPVAGDELRAQPGPVERRVQRVGIG